MQITGINVQGNKGTQNNKTQRKNLAAFGMRKVEVVSEVKDVFGKVGSRNYRRSKSFLRKLTGLLNSGRERNDKVVINAPKGFIVDPKGNLTSKPWVSLVRQGTKGSKLSERLEWRDFAPWMVKNVVSRLEGKHKQNLIAERIQRKR